MKTTVEVRLKLESLYMTESLSSRLYLKGRFFTFKMKDGKNMQDHIDEFNKLCLDLENIQIEYEDEDKALVLKFGPKRKKEGKEKDTANGDATVVE
ncbi:hypothetical protein EZV62_011028 [Acer yangbiense]|uniref:Reverse transcriptase Ty1/copia-type domain-containing protein n=1 Tax=Acer yangbiense TaxID=1000413 RepID=A0A5C7I4M5_9ROSI|nr:hypothetical protein EZV62_011028 [Acer yangbiense]